MKRITRSTVDRTGNGYCGPLVLAAILGCTTAEAAEKVRRANSYSGGHAIKGMYTQELRHTLRAHGFEMIREEVAKKHIPIALFGGMTSLQGPTLANWLRSREDVNALHVVVVSNHYVLVKGRKMVDTYTRGEWVFISKAPHRRKRVQSVYRVVPLS